MESINLEKKLPQFARELISGNYHLSETERNIFLENYDSPEEHNPSWHQWGIATHSLKTREAYDTEFIDYLEAWGMTREINKYLGQEIDDTSKGELLRLSLPIHDLGKFLKKDKSNFENHEEESGE